MLSESYTPGHSQNATDFMSRRSLASHGSFFVPYLASGTSVLDCGCGPGTITVGLTAHVAPGDVVGVDCEQTQIDQATAYAAHTGVSNVRFQTASCYALPFHEARFDRVFSHALMEHLADPGRALREMHRVLKPGGIIGLCSPDWGGFILSPSSPALSRAIEGYVALQARNGGNVLAGRMLGQHLAAAGFQAIRLSARYECYASLGLIGEYLAWQLEREGDLPSARTFRAWSQREEGLFAQAWVSAVATRP